MQFLFRISVRKPQTPAERARRLRQKAIGLIDQTANELQKTVNLGFLVHETAKQIAQKKAAGGQQSAASKKASA